MVHGSLESGLGGFDYAAEMMGWENVFHCEINPFCRTILKYYWPHAKSYSDIFEFDARQWRGKVDIITAGFPCQPFSHAGKRKGSKDDRHIWPENLRIIKEVQPPIVIAENVPGLLTIEGGLVFETVCADLENEGYEVTPFIIPACAKDAVHRRDRIWIVAHNSSYRQSRWIRDSERRNKREQGNKEIREGFFNKSISKNSNVTNPNDDGLEGRQGREGIWVENGRNDSTTPNHTGKRQRPGQPRSNSGSGEFMDCFRDATNAPEKRLQGSKQTNGSEGAQPYDQFIDGCSGEWNESWIEAATRLCSVDDEFAGRLDTSAISKSKWRTESLKAYGNAIYWPVVYEIFKAIEKYE